MLSQQGKQQGYVSLEQLEQCGLQDRERTGFDALGHFSQCVTTDVLLLSSLKNDERTIVVRIAFSSIENKLVLEKTA